jgi:CRP-like cAMP-binding protein
MTPGLPRVSTETSMSSATPTGSILEQLSPAERDALLGHARVRPFRPGEVLLQEGAPGESLLVIRDGQVEVRRGDRVLATLGAGHWLGEMALLDPAPRSATVRGTVAGTAWELDRETFLALLAQGDPAGVKALGLMTATLCARLAAVNRMVQDAVAKPAAKDEPGLWGRLWRSMSAVGKS